MRTTLNLAPEALAKVRQLAEQRRETLGAVASELIFRALAPREGPSLRNGVPVFPASASASGLPASGLPASGAPAPDLELVNRLRDEEP